MKTNFSHKIKEVTRALYEIYERVDANVVSF